MTVLVVDGEPDDTTSDDDFRVIHPADLPLSADEFARMRAIYDVTELCTAVKPSLLETLRETGDVAVYLDPDIQVFGSLAELEPLAEEHGIVLTPHALDPYPDDGLLIDEATVLRAGAFNLGFIAVGRGSDPFLRWWASRLAEHALNAPMEGLFTDQRWIDLVPSLFDCHVVRDRGWNVAYWNLHERPLRRDPHSGAIHVGDAPLRFLHFSGYDPDAPHIVSKHQGDRPRITRHGHDVFSDLLDDYGDALRTSGWDDRHTQPYRWSELDGRPISQRLRRLLRDAHRIDAAHPAPDPFADGGLDALQRWLGTPVAAAHGTRLDAVVLDVWRHRRDLQVAFPDPLGADLPALARWAVSARERGEDPDLLSFWKPRSAPRVTSSGPAGPGITVAGYLRAELGVGEAARLTIRGAEQVGLPVTTVTYSDTRSRQLHLHRERVGGVHDLCVICVNADRTSHFLGAIGGLLDDVPVRAGLWFWEVDEFPEQFAAAARLLDEVWVASEFVQAAVEPVVDVPVRLFPLPIVPDPPTRLSRADLDLPADRWVCAFAFDTLSIVSRKNPLAAVEAFREAFSVDDQAYLLIKINNGWANRHAVEELRYRTRDRSDIRIVDDVWTPERVQALYQLIDGYVSLHRSEGFGLTMAQAMAQGTPVIATGYSGNLAFMTRDNSLLVPSTDVAVGPGCAPYPPDARWAEPDVAAAAAHLRTLRFDPEFAASVGARAAADIQRHHSPALAADFLRDAAVRASTR